MAAGDQAEERVYARQEIVALLEAERFSHWCVMCEHMWRAVRAGGRECGMSCGGPMTGRSFPAYRGPLESTLRSSLCFVCGGKPVKLVECADRGILGCCVEHLKILQGGE